MRVDNGVDNQLSNNLKVISYKFLKNRLSTPLSTLRNSWYWRSLSLPVAPWRSLALPGTSWCSVSLPVAPWRSLVLLGAPWRFLVLPGAPWRSLALPGAPWRSLTLPGAPWRSMALPLGRLACQNSGIRTNIYTAAINACEKAKGLNRVRESIGLCVCVYICVYVLFALAGQG